MQKIQARRIQTKQKIINFKPLSLTISHKRKLAVWIRTLFGITDSFQEERNYLLIFFLSQLELDSISSRFRSPVVDPPRARKRAYITTGNRA